MRDTNLKGRGIAKGGKDIAPALVVQFDASVSAAKTAEASAKAAEAEAAKPTRGASQR